MTEALAISNMDDLSRMSKMFAQSGMFSDVKDAAQAGVKIMAGQAMGIAPFVAMKNIHIIKGQASVGAGIISAAIKASPKYDYRPIKMDATECVLQVVVKGEDGYKAEVRYGIEDAERAGLTSSNTWVKYPQNMLFARCIANMHRFHCPDIFMGTPVYEESELQAVDVEIVETQSALPNGNEAQAVDPIDTLEVPSEPVDLSELIAQTDVELTRIGWDAKQGRKHLKDTYGVQSRQQLDEKQLQHFLAHLQKLSRKAAEVES